MRYWLVLAFFLALSPARAEGLRLHVAPDGSDQNPGTADKPFATLEKARDALRAARPLPPGGAVVTLADGVYRLDAPLTLGADDGGREGAPVIYRAANRARAVISGAGAATRWEKTADPAVLRLLPPEARPHVLTAAIPGTAPLPDFHNGGNGIPHDRKQYPPALFQNGARLTLARWPDAGFAQTGECLSPDSFTLNGRTHFRQGIFRITPPEKLERWRQEPDLWLHGLWFYEWADMREKVTAVDPEKQTLTVSNADAVYGFRPGADYYAFNAFCELDRPGEYVIDRRARRLYLWPAAGVEKSPPALALAEHLLCADRTRHLVLDGLVFAHARKNALRFRETEHVTVQASIVCNTQAWGMEFAGGRDALVTGCDLFDLGEGGIILDGGGSAAREPARHTADNNHIHHYGRFIANYQPGILLNGTGCRATHNLIHHSQHQAVEFRGNDHYIGYNIFHDTCSHNDDAGAVYCCQRDWSRRGTVIEYNLAHHTGKNPRPTNTDAFYLDDYSSGVTVRGNIASRCTNGVHIGGGQDNVVEGNLFLNCARGVYVGSRGADSFAKDIADKGAESEMFQRLRAALAAAPSLAGRYPKMAAVLEMADAVHAHYPHFNIIRNNLAVPADAVKIDPWEHVRDTCTVSGNVEQANDPGLADYARMDFRFKPGSPAAKTLGESRFAQMGLYPSPLRVSPAVKFGEGATPPRPLHKEHELPKVRIDLALAGEPPAGRPGAPASNLHGCETPEWAAGRRIVAEFGYADLENWKEYAFRFTPEYDAELQLELMGVYGEKTGYDDITADGAELKDGGLETPDAWTVLNNVEKPARGRVAPPYGIAAGQPGIAPHSGKTLALCNHERRLAQKIRVKKGVPVSIKFFAKGWLEGQAARAENQAR